MIRSTAGRALVAAALIALSAGPLTAQQVLQLSNGDRLTGQLTAISGTNWTFHFSGADATIAATDVVGFTATAPIGVRLDDGTIGAATVQSTGGQLELTFANGTTRRVAPSALAAVGAPDALDALRPIHIGLFSPFTRFWGATGSLGFSDQSGNSRARGLSATLDVERKTSSDRLAVGGGLNRQSSQPPGGTFAETVEKYYGYLRADVYVNAVFFVFGETRQEHDKFQDIRLRSLYNAGLGTQLVSTKATDLRVSLSAGLRRESYYSNGSDHAAVGGASLGLNQQLGPALFAWRADWTPNLQDFADYRLRSDASVTAPVIAGLGFRVGFLDEYNNRPQPTIKKNDVLLTTTITYSIGG